MTCSRGAVVLDMVVKKGFSQMRQHFRRDMNKVNEWVL